MTKILSVLILLLVLLNGVKGQDSVILVFKNIKISLPKRQFECPTVIWSSKYTETVFFIGNKDRYFYIKQRNEDTLVVEAGELKLFSIRNDYYLLREGIWSLESTTNKILFANLGENGLIEEIEIDTTPVMYKGYDRKRKRRIRKAITRTIE